jgi:hypothetical protein
MLGGERFLKNATGALCLGKRRKQLLDGTFSDGPFIQ